MPRPKLSPTVRLAAAFSRRLHYFLSPQQLAEAVARNRTPQYAHACATHDFCDANLLMASAFLRVQRRAINLQSDADRALWNAAWDLAKRNEFKV